MPRLLLISYHFPPSEAAGALRWQRLASIGGRLGWSIQVLALAPGQAEAIDWQRIGELPPDLRIHGVRQPESRVSRLGRMAWRVRNLLTRPRAPAPEATGARPGTLHYQEMGWLRGGRRALERMANVVIEYAHDSAWRNEAVRTGERVVANWRPDLILSCGPPHRAHEAARRLAGRLGVPFVMDLRDPWSQQHRLHEHLASPLWYRVANWEEQRCVMEADLIVMNTPRAAEQMQARWPRVRIISVLNGWDDEVLPRAPWPEQFRIVFAGTIYIDRDPGPFFRAVAAAVRHLQVDPERFEVRLIGSVESFDGRSLGFLAREAGIADFVKLLPPKPRREVLMEYAEAAVLLSLPQDSHHAVPSKVYEYMCQPCWIVAQADRESATASVLDGTGARVIPPNDETALTRALVECYEQFRAGQRPEPIARGGRFSRAGEGARLFAELARVLDADRSPDREPGRHE